MIAALAFLGGTLAALAAVQVPAPAWIVMAVVLAGLVLMSPVRARRAALALVAFIAAMALVFIDATRWLELRDGAPPPGERALIVGRVVSVPARDGADWRFIVEARFGDSADARLHRVRLAWRDAETTPQSGEQWRWLVKLSPLAANLNLAGMDRERLAFRDRIHANARVLTSALNERLSAAPRYSIDGARARIGARIAAAVADPDAAALLTALAVGLTHDMTADQWRVFNATGTSHLVAISGLHVTLFALVAFALARIVWRVVPRVAAYIDREPFAWMSGLAAALGYALLAGFSVPTQRTLLMLGVFGLAHSLGRVAGAARVWSLALIAVLLFDPFAPLSAGFWLSFVAVGAILLTAGTPLIRDTRLALMVRVQLAVMIALAPLTLAVFGSVSLAALWANAFAIPIVTFLLVPLVLAGAMATFASDFVADLCFTWSARLYELAWPGLVWAADGQAAMWRSSPPSWTLAAAALGCLVLLLPWPRTVRASAALLLLPLIFHGQVAFTGARISVFDAGRGTAVLIATHSRTLLFDTADHWGSRGAGIQHVVLPALDALGRRSVDGLILPRLTQDRAHGAALLAQQRELSVVWVGGGWRGARLRVADCVPRRWSWDGVEFELLAPAGQCALRVSMGGGALLLAGDLDTKAEQRLLRDRDGAALASDAVIIGRGAGAGASGREWIDTLAPRFAIASGGVAGASTRRATLARWAASGARILDTQRDGEIVLALDGNGISLLGTARTRRYPFLWRR